MEDTTMADSTTIFQLHAPKALRDAIRKGEDFCDYELNLPPESSGKVVLRVLPWGRFDDIDLPAEAGLNDVNTNVNNVVVK
jgi:hypothetical protein